MTNGFTIKRSLVTVEGGALSEPWVLEVKRQKVMLFDVEFIELSMQDRKFARALGLDLHKRAPFEDTTLMQHIAKLRNELVDEMIQKKRVTDDPLADGVNAPVCVKDRAKAFVAACLPQVIEIRIAGFTNAAGDRIPEKRLKVYSTPRRDGVLTVELSEDTLAWFVQAVALEWNVNGAPWVKTASPQSEDDLPELLNPSVCKFKRRGDISTWAITCWFRTSNGDFKQFTKTLGNVDHMQQDMLAMHVRAVETKVMRVYETNHVPPEDDDARESSQLAV